MATTAELTIAQRHLLLTIRTQLEDDTDRVSSASFTDEMHALAEAAEDSIVDLARAIKASGAVTFPNPTGTRVP